MGRSTFDFCLGGQRSRSFRTFVGTTLSSYGSPTARSLGVYLLLGCARNPPMLRSFNPFFSCSFTFGLFTQPDVRMVNVWRRCLDRMQATAFLGGDCIQNAGSCILSKPTFGGRIVDVQTLTINVWRQSQRPHN